VDIKLDIVGWTKDCVHKVVCMCGAVWSVPTKSSTLERDLAEWRRIEGVDQYILRKRY
jgi:hypothetical protein